MKRLLSDTLAAKWTEATTGPPHALKEMLEGSDAQFREKLLYAQGRCKELMPYLEARNRLLTATHRDSVKDAGEFSKDYRLSPEDGVLERNVFVTKASIWVPVMPTTVIPPELFGTVGENVTWRRYAFDRAHTTFLEPHRSSGSTWQALKRMAFWKGMHKDFTVWINACAVCHQYRTVGVVAPMRSTLQSIDEFARLPWKDVIIDCQGPFTRSARGNCYTVSYHCTFLGICKVEPFARLRKRNAAPLLIEPVGDGEDSADPRIIDEQAEQVWSPF